MRGRSSAGRVVAGLVGVATLLLVAALWLAGPMPETADEPPGDEIALERNVSTQALPGLGSRSRPVVLRDVPLDVTVHPAPVVDADLSAPLVVLRAGGLMQVVDVAEGVTRQTILSRSAQGLTVVNGAAVVRTGRPDPGLWVVDLQLDRAGVAEADGLLHGPAMVLLTAQRRVQAWTPKLRGNFVGWSGVTLRVTDRGVEAVAFPRLGPPLRPVAVARGRLLADALGTAVLVDDDGSWVPAGRGTPVALAGDRVVRTSCEPVGCRLLVGGPGAPDDERIPLPAGTSVVDAGAVVDPTGRWLVVALGDGDGRRRPAVVDLDGGRVRLLPDVLPPSSTVGRATWSPDGRWLFMPWAHHVLVWNRDGRTDLLDLGGSGAVLQVAMR